ncbi:MAG: pyridoxamine 5'-phosphate oxidase family protein [Chloroflexi bacterium]|nr:pyridoxamine 5'-phosphate oxidase family protein [Chloroflexota bacterium]
MTPRARAVEAYLKALRTGEASATVSASRHLAPDVVLDTIGAHMWGNGPEHFEGYDQVVPMITGIGVITGIYRTAPWTDPVPVEDGKLQVSAQIGGLLSSSTLTFTFNDQDQIVHVNQVNAGGSPSPLVDRMPDFVKAYVNSALANNTPLIIAYTDLNGAPNLSLRGSTQAYSDTQLSIWVRHANGGMANALRSNPRMALMYRDPPARANLTFEGVGHFESDPDVRDRVFELMPEVEQKHDPGRIGACLIIDVQRVNGSTPRGAVRMQAAVPAAATT